MTPPTPSKERKRKGWIDMIFDTPSPLCKCGHKKEEHDIREYSCLHEEPETDLGFCKCNKFIPAQEVSKGYSHIHGKMLNSDKNELPLKEPLETSHIMTADRISIMVDRYKNQDIFRKSLNPETKFIFYSEVEKLRDDKILEEHLENNNMKRHYLSAQIDILNKLLEEGKE